MVRFVFLAVVSLLLVALAFCCGGCLPAGASLSSGLRSGYWSLMNEPMPDSLVVPVADVRRKQLRNSWGSPRDGGRAHEGIDIFARRNTPVVSATHGIITRKGESERGGQVVWVMGPGGQSHYYAHLDSFGVQESGAWVEAGDTIGFVGTTGNAKGTPPHLHYGIYTDTGAVNPYPLLVTVPTATARSAQR